MTARRSVGLLMMAIALTAGGSAIAGGQDKSQDKNTIAAAIGDLDKAQLVEVRDQSGQAILTGTLKTSKNSSKETERKAKLTSPTGQKAEGDVEVTISRKDGVATKDEIELDLEDLPAMANCQLFIDGILATSFVTEKDGKIEFKVSRKLNDGGR